jgi:N-formylglutamate amidohydrolase
MVERGAAQTSPAVLSSPHSGSAYPAAFLAQAGLGLRSLRLSEDAFVDQLFGAAPALGVPLLKALFPRVFVDPNREPYELDAEMFRTSVPEYVNTRSPRVAVGLGTVPKIVASGERIYRTKLDFDDVLTRLNEHYFPFHDMLQSLLAETHDRFGCSLLIDCHSMPSIAGEGEADRGDARADFVLGDRHGTSCAPAVVRLVERALTDKGFSVRRNVPYAGGYITERYGRPWQRRHALQIEINRALYMDERTIEPNGGFQDLCAHLADIIQMLARIDQAMLIR